MPAGAIRAIRHGWPPQRGVRPSARVGLCAALVVVCCGLASTASAKNPSHNQLAAVGDMIFVHNQEVTQQAGGPGIGVGGFVGNAVANYALCKQNQMASGDVQQEGWAAIQQDGQQETSNLTDGLVAFNASLDGWNKQFHALERVVGPSGKAGLRTAALDIADAENQHGLEIAALKMSASDLSAANPDCDGSFNELEAASIPGAKAWSREAAALRAAQVTLLRATRPGPGRLTLSGQKVSNANPYACLGNPATVAAAELACPVS